MTRYAAIVLGVAIQVMALGSSSLYAQFRDWNDRYGNWSDWTKWNPNLVPG